MRHAYMSRVSDWFMSLQSSVSSKRALYMARRPHRSFRHTRRRDYVRSLDLPGYWAFTFSVFNTLMRQKRLFVGLIAVYAVLGGIFIGIASQQSYTELSNLLDETGSEIFVGSWSGIGQTGLLLLTSLSGSINPDMTDAQRVYSALILLLTWLTTVWLLRSVLAGERPKLRDGLYNAGAPIIGTAVVLAVFVAQLLPATLGIIIFNSAVSTGVFDTGFMAMLISIVTGMLILISAYWVTSTLIALIIITLPGMYPWPALRAAGDIVIGRRSRILLRFAWLLVLNLVVMLGTLLPIVLIQRLLVAALPALAQIPIVPLAVSIVSATVIVWSASYVYLLYRKVVEDDAKPA